MAEISRMLLTREQLETLVAQARRDAPNETCGLIGGKDDRAEVIYPLTNAAENPRVEYRADPEAQFAAMKELEAHDQGMLGIYHSHPASPAYPSPTDVERAFYPEAIYILISLLNPKAAEVRAFTIRESRITEVTLDVVEQEETSYGQARTNPRRHQKAKGRPSPGRAVASLSKGRSGKRTVRKTHR